MLSNPLFSGHKIRIASRSSPLARAQVKEFLALIKKYDPYLEFECCFVSTTGDKDQQTSLRTLGKTDFFTKEIDELLLAKTCRLAVHSAKDLPTPLPKELSLMALTPSIDPRDSLVFREGESLERLPSGAVIATSSLRREETVKRLRSDLTFIDLRGTIDQRLAKLASFDADGVVVAEAAIIRLGLTHLNRIQLPGETVPYQGQLAIVGLEEDVEMKQFFLKITHLDEVALCGC